MAFVPEDADLAEVVRREQELLEPTLRRSSALLRELLHPDFVEFGASGRVWDRAGIIAALEAEPGVSGEGTDYSPVRLSASVVLLTYEIAGRPGSLRCSVWVKDPAAGWLLRFHQGTPRGEAGGRRGT